MTRGGPPVWGLGERLTTLYHRKPPCYKMLCGYYIQSVTKASVYYIYFSFLMILYIFGETDAFITIKRLAVMNCKV
jgi:hypothetical protein